MTRYFIILLLHAMNALCSAQELGVVDFRAEAFDRTATTNPVVDANGNVCALVKVEAPVADVKFEGNVVKSVFNTNEYWVYMSPESLKVNVRCPGRKSLMVDFTPYVGRKGLAPRQTYVLSISGFGNDSNGNIPQLVTITHTPEDAIVLINGKIIDSRNGVAMLLQVETKNPSKIFRKLFTNLFFYDY